MLVFSSSLMLSGCKLLVPYDSEFMCSANPDYGKCTDVQGAYSDALGGIIDKEVAAEPGDAKKHKSGAVQHPLPASPAQRYKAAQYVELAKTIEAPVTPIVKQPTVLRTLIVAYSSSERTLYMPRYMFFFADAGEFVLGDYLSNSSPSATPSIFPNGVR